MGSTLTAISNLQSIRPLILLEKKIGPLIIRGKKKKVLKEPEERGDGAP
jgi:hypothetical protein